MAIDTSTENSSLNTSPRISFSHDLCQTDEAAAVEDKPYRLDSMLQLDSDSDDFAFCITSNSTGAHETSSAEELFSGGLIRPVQLQERFVHTPKNASKSKAQAHQVPSLPPLPFVPQANGGSKQEILQEKESTLTNIEPEQKNQSKSFWGIKRSSSLHCDNGHKKSSFWSLPLLSRSNSTGSVPNSKQGLRESQKQNASSKQQKNLMGISASASASSNATSAPSFYVYPLSQKPPLRKNYMGSNGNGIRISPVLNVPVPSSHISKGTANLLGLGSFFRNGKDKKMKK
ncbi:uncharacterized protein [Coffea arabica]|uniref:Uncharacterized protein n=1 Tax=Coffea arabica TaxID=13443 RepID=A0ABM4U3E9_COFAR